MFDIIWMCTKRIQGKYVICLPALGWAILRSLLTHGDIMKIHKYSNMGETLKSRQRTRSEDI